MKKSDLRTGMRVTLRNGKKRIVLLQFKHEYDKETDVIVDTQISSWNPLSSYDEDLKHRNYYDNDIVKIEVPEHVYVVFGTDSYHNYKMIWERNDTKEMTVEEIQQALGYKIKVVESKR